MSLKTNIIKNDKEFLKKKKIIKNEIKKLILKSIINNRNEKPIIRSLSNYRLSKLKNWSKSKQKNNICLKTGRFKGVLNTYNVSRHQIKKLILKNQLQNTKINSW